MPRFRAVAVLTLLLPATAHAEPPTTPPFTAPPLPPRAGRPTSSASNACRDIALAATFEIVSPIGGAGNFFQRRYLAGALVTAASLISGGLMLHGLVRHNGDEISLNAVAYGVSRFIGIVSAVRPDPAPVVTPPPSALEPHASTFPAFSVPAIEIAYRYAFVF